MDFQFGSTLYRYEIVNGALTALAARVTRESTGETDEAGLGIE